MQIARNFPLAIPRLGETQHQHGQGLHGETPDHSEGVERGQLVDIAAAQNNSQQLHADDQIDDAVARAVAVMRFLEPAGEHSIFGHAIQNSVGSHNGSILRTRENQHSHQHDEAMEQQLDAGGAHQIYGDAADEVGEIIRPDAVGNNHYREE